MCTRHRQLGISLVELIMFIVIVSVALVGILLVMDVTEKGSADPLVHKQALAAAQSLLEEIELQDFNPAGAHAIVTLTNRATQYHIVSDYQGFNTTGIYNVDGTGPIAGLANYNASVTETNTALNGIAAGNAVFITVTVTDLHGNPIQVSGYRTAY
ncbi:MAG: type II secretion system protein [Gallionella sp.]